MDRDTLFNWIGDPLGSAATWLANNTVGYFRRGAFATVPDLYGMFVVQARSLLTQTDLRVKVIEQPGSGGLGQIVVRQEPAAGLTVRRRTRVTVHVAPMNQVRPV
jgi:beta-lactam-binding protein with PASTA domain